jgi:hypothetical protein
MLHLIDSATLEQIGSVLERTPEPLRRITLGLRVRIWTEVWHRDVELELTRRGYGRAPIGT